jgi:hypothetical protein
LAALFSRRDRLSNALTIGSSIDTPDRAQPSRPLGSGRRRTRTAGLAARSGRGRSGACGRMRAEPRSPHPRRRPPRETHDLPHPNALDRRRSGVRYPSAQVGDRCARSRKRHGQLPSEPPLRSASERTASTCIDVLSTEGERTRPCDHEKRTVIAARVVTSPKTRCGATRTTCQGWRSSRSTLCSRFAGPRNRVVVVASLPLAE